jgi:hypothetical protein
MVICFADKYLMARCDERDDRHGTTYCPQITAPVGFTTTETIQNYALLVAARVRPVEIHREFITRRRRSSGEGFMMSSATSIT